jgi:NAD(P)-dependent dehydrogenase (short-subunit alcohol dehydrogenase family)
MPADHTVLITGSTDGHGLALARRLAADGARVLVHGRDREKVDRVVGELSDGANQPGGYVADLASLDQVRQLAREVAADHDRLDVLVNNAGIVTAEGRQTSEDGFELVLAVNYLAHFLLTLELLDRLRAAERSRIVNVASIGQAAIDFDDLMLEREWDAARSYAQSKLAQILFTIELAERLGPGATPTVTALHPATFMETKMVTDIGRTPLNTVERGMEATLRLAVGAEVEGVTGKFFDVLEESTADPQAYDADARRRLWELSEELTGTSLAAA